MYYHKIKWVIQIISQYAQTPYEFVSEKHQSKISVGSSSEFDIKIDRSFFDKINNGHTKWNVILPNGPIYKNEQGEECILETIFYLVNCIQEMDPSPDDLDHYGRFKFTSSLQYHYGIIEENFVGTLINKLILLFPVLSMNGSLPRQKSKIFISHDIDLLRSGWKIEAYLALKKYKWGLLWKVIWDIIRQKPFYNNIDQVIALDKKYGITSCFYWLPQYGKDRNGIMNADYTLGDLRAQSQKVLDAGLDCGIHKSSFESTFNQEMEQFPFKVEHNRCHFLKFQTHKVWKEIEAAGLKTDASLGFAEHIGFRNSYGLPFVPYDMENDRPYSFVEIPLHVMDVSLTKYMQLNTFGRSQRLEAFFNQNNRNCLINILWHNDHFTTYSYKNESSLFFEILQKFAIESKQKMKVYDIYEMYKLAQ